jgi:hypothetical protein
MVLRNIRGGKCEVCVSSLRWEINDVIVVPILLWDIKRGKCAAGDLGVKLE